MLDTDHELNHWLSVHERVRKNIQRTFIFLAVIAGLAGVRFNNHLLTGDEIYNLAREFTLQISKKEEGQREQLVRLFKERCRKANPAPYCDEGHIYVRLEEIPEVGGKYKQYLKKHYPSEKFELKGIEFGNIALAVLFNFAPLGLLVVIYLRLRTTEKIAMMLREHQVKRSEIQQRCNSLFSGRATRRLGERRWIYATVWVIVMIVLTSLPATTGLLLENVFLDIHTEVKIDNQGNLSPLPEKPWGHTMKSWKKGLADISPVILFYFIIIFILGFFILRTVVKQLKPLVKPELITDRNAP